MKSMNDDKQIAEIAKLVEQLTTQSKNVQKAKDLAAGAQKVLDELKASGEERLKAYEANQLAELANDVKVRDQKIQDV